MDIIGKIKRWLRKFDRRTFVSVVVPVHNGEATVGECLDSLLGQTLKRVKIICVDDGSTDNSAKILRKYARRHWRVKVIRQKNGGRSAARNTGLQRVKTKYVMFCDDDDKYEPTMCEEMVKVVRGSGADMAVCGMKIEYEAHAEMRKSDEEYYRIWFNGLKTVDDRVIKKTDDSVCNKVFRMDVIWQNGVEFPEGLDNEDYYFCNAFMSVANTAFFVKDKLYQYMRRTDSVMSRNFEAKELSLDHLLVAERLFKFYKKNGFLKQHKNLFWEQWVASFWSSYRYSAEEYHGLVEEEAKKFVDKNYDKNKPEDEWVQGLVNDVVKTFKKGKEKK